MQHRISPWELCSAGTVAFGIIPHTRWLCRKWYPVSGEAGYGSDYSWAITSKAIACAFTIGCSTGKKGPDNYFFMIMPSWWMWMIIAIQGEREFFFCVCEMETRGCHRAVTSHWKHFTCDIHTKNPPAAPLMEEGKGRGVAVHFNAKRWKMSLKEGERCLALGLLIGSHAGLLVTYLRFPSTEGSFSGGGRRGGGWQGAGWGRAGVQMPWSMTAIFYTAGGQSPQWWRPWEQNYGYLHARE